MPTYQYIQSANRDYILCLFVYITKHETFIFPLSDKSRKTFQPKTNVETIAPHKANNMVKSNFIIFTLKISFSKI